MIATNLRFVLFTTIAAVLLSINDSFEIPFLKTCTMDDVKCQIEQVDKAFALYGNGIPELDLPTLNTMRLDNITINGNSNGNSNDNFNLQLFMQNVDLFKFPEVKCLNIKGFDGDLTKPKRLAFKMFSPQLILKAHCRVKGKLLLFTVDGETDLTIDLHNVTTTMKVSLKPYKKDGLNYYKADEMKPMLDIGRLSNSFTNFGLFNGEEIFKQTFTDTINENWQVLSEEILPPINKAVAKVLLEVLNKILPTIPTNKFFKDVE